MKIIITLLGLLNGSYMLLDGLFVLFKGKYIGTEKPGPWAIVFYKLNINVFKLAPLFIIYGLLWLLWIFAVWSNQRWAYLFGLIISILTIWYIPIGTFFSLIIFFALLLAKKQLGL